MNVFNRKLNKKNTKKLKPIEIENQIDGQTENETETEMKSAFDFFIYY